MNKIQLLIFIGMFVGMWISGFMMGYGLTNLYILNEEINEDLNTMSCYGVSLYTDWRDSFFPISDKAQEIMNTECKDTPDSVMERIK